MCFGIVTSDGFTIPPIWIDGNQDSSKYCEMLQNTVTPTLNCHYGAGNWVLQQGRAPCHTSTDTQKFLKDTLGLRGFWLKEFWPPNRPNLNLLNYHMCT